VRSRDRQVTASRPDALQHPIEIPRARRFFVGAVVLGTLTSPSVIVAMMLVLWAVSNNPVTPVVGAILGLLAMAYVERRYRSDAWAYIARRRQDRGRDEPGAWSLAAFAVEVACLIVGTSLVVLSGRADVASLAVGALLGLIAVVVLTVAWDLRAPSDRRILYASPSVEIAFAAIAVAVAAVGVILLAGEDFVGIEAVAGATAAIAVAVIGLLFRLIPLRVSCLPPGIPLP
jgi:hypothetical protein